MTNPSLKIGDNKWAVKESNLLGYRTLRNKYIPIELDVTRSTTATRVNEAGLIEETPYNLLTYSNDFSNAIWIKSGASASTENFTNPRDEALSYFLKEDSTNGAHQIYTANTIVAGSINTISFLLKRKVGSADRFLRVQSTDGSFSNGARVIFDIQNMIISTSVASLGTGSNVSASIESFGADGWFKVSLTCKIDEVSTVFRNNNYLQNQGSSFSASYQGDGTSGAYIWGAQLNAGSVAKPYFPTTDRLNIPQIDYTDGYSSILIEPQRTNLLTYSNDFSTFNNSQYWILNNEISPDGTMNASTLTFTGANQYTNKSTSIGVGVICSSSVYVKGNLNETIIFNCGGVDKVHTLTGNWQRLKTENKTSVNSTVAFSTYGGVSGRQFLVYGVQIEQGSYATSYIPTVASTVTRNATTVSKTGISDLINSEEGTFFVKAKVSNNNSLNLFSLHENITNNNRLLIGFNTTNNFILFYLEKNGSVQINAVFSVTDISSSFIKVAFVYKVNNSAFFINGIKVGGDLLCETFGINTLSNFSFSNASGSSSFNGNVKQLQIYKEALTDTECIALTTI